MNTALAEAGTRLVKCPSGQEALELVLAGRCSTLIVDFDLPGAEESSRPGESHPQALTDPDMNVSAHPALTVLVVARCSSGQ